jgi:histidine triad (HIT) family protein
MDCLFCKIANKEMPSDIVYEDDEVIVFKDINPKAHFHVLVIPKRHIVSIKDLRDEDKELTAKIVFTAKKVAEDNNLSGYKLIFNVGREGGQIVDHLHLHLLSGRPTELP